MLLSYHIDHETKCRRVLLEKSVLYFKGKYPPESVDIVDIDFINDLLSSNQITDFERELLRLNKKYYSTLSNVLHSAEEKHISDVLWGIEGDESIVGTEKFYWFKLYETVFGKWPVFEEKT